MVAPRHPFLERFAESSGDLLPPSPPAEKATARQDQAGQSRTDDGAGDSSQLASDLTTGEIRSVDVKVGLSAFDPRDQRRLGLRNSTREHGDKGRIVDQRLREIEDLGGVSPGGHYLREPGKHRCCGGDTGVRAERRAAMDVRPRNSGRGQAAKRCSDLYCLGRRIEHYRCEARPGRRDRIGSSFAPERSAVKVIGSHWRLVPTASGLPPS